jgi:hypothetical protein
MYSQGRKTYTPQQSFKLLDATFALQLDPHGSNLRFRFTDFQLTMVGFAPTNLISCQAPEYKARERIHRDEADSRLLAIPTS